ARWRDGHAPASTVGQALRDKVPAGRRLTNPEAKRTETRRMYAEIWRQLRDALELLGGLPLPNEVAKMARGKDQGRVIDRRIGKSIQWLEEFRNAWRGNDNARAADEAGHEKSE